MLQPRKVSGIKYLLAVVIRFVLLHTNFRSSIQDRVEISTPLNSWKRLLEGIHLYNREIDPYSGDLFHESPIILIICRFLLNHLGPVVEAVFVAMDVLVAYLLYKTAAMYISQIKNEEESKLKKGVFCKASENLIVTEEDAQNIPAYVAFSYLFNPYIILNCAALTTTNFSNLLLAGVFYSMVKRRQFICVLLLSLIAQQSFYLFTLLVPVCLQFYNFEKTKKCIFQILITFTVIFAGLLGLCYSISGSWKFIESTYGVILNVSDLTPNIGLFWYFFTEMFDHFRALFISALQINATVLYLFPLALHLRNEPIFLSFIIVALTAVFKSYPSLGDVGFYFSLLPIWKHLFFFMRQTFNITCLLIITSALGPTVWHLWIYAGSANANFFFGVTLAFAIAQIFLITDLLFARKKRTFALKIGLPDDSSGSTLVLD
ncbi:hypothetical protein RUM44_006764 [Polyplax serrata]|uniref:Phosphatidylinositol glycan anchor biosynthesis class U protein n=1 Tax=Polyplax serrata TaxID=468196 RepID=A0ABR1AJ24_POLSC